MNELVIAIGLMLVLEGLVYSLMPDGMKRMAQDLLKVPDTTLRVFGVGAITAGVILVWLIKG